MNVSGVMAKVEAAGERAGLRRIGQVVASAVTAAGEVGGVTAEAIDDGVRLRGGDIRRRMARGEMGLIAWLELVRADARGRR